MFCIAVASPAARSVEVSRDQLYAGSSPADSVQQPELGTVSTQTQ